MASKFYAGMKNVVEALNEMWAVFAAGPFNALPLSGGALSGPVASSSSIRAATVFAGTSANINDASALLSPNNGAAGALNVYYPAAAIGATSIPGVSNGGRFVWSTTSGPGANATGYSMILQAQDAGTGISSNVLLAANGDGVIAMPGRMRVGPGSPSRPHCVIQGVQAEGNVNLELTNNALFYVGSGSYGNSAGCSLLLSTNNVTGRSLNVGGTINASGADYAEYMIKSTLCGAIAPGRIVGIDADGRLTDKWDRAIAFMVKSTNPCMVGGDSWAQDLGARPSAPTRIPPSIEQELVSPAVPADPASGTDAVAAVFRSIVTAPGDTDAEWAARETDHAGALAAFDAALEQRRQTVDRIAFAGQVPVNVLGATPGQYIVPFQDGEGIAGEAVDRGDMTLDQYMSAIGRVIAIEDDGRARIIVKVA